MSGIGTPKDKVLVLNTGSSSVKFGLYSIKEDALLLKGRVERLGSPDALLVLERFYGSGEDAGTLMEERPAGARDVHHAIPLILDLLLKERFLRSLDEILAVGHRVVHGAETYTTAVVVTSVVEEDIRELSRFAPLHNPFNLDGIRRCKALVGGAPSVAVFDTAFHHTMPREVFLYGISPRLYERFGVRKYGFHGTNHKYCSLRAKELLGTMPKRLVTCHLGNGSSVTAIEDGLSVDTSMGFTPTDGLIMGTRSGAIDPEAVLYLTRELRLSPEKVDAFLNKESGLKAIAGSSDMRDIRRKADRGDPDARLALDMLIYRIRRFIGGYAATLGGLDCLVFTGGIGENAWYVREAVCERLEYLGILLDRTKNRANDHEISSSESKVKVFVIPANEELQIARETRDAIK